MKAYIRAVAVVLPPFSSLFCLVKACLRYRIWVSDSDLVDLDSRLKDITVERRTNLQG